MMIRETVSFDIIDTDHFVEIITSANMWAAR